VLDAELPRFADKFDVFSGSIGLDLVQERLEAPVDGGLIEERMDSLWPSRRLGRGVGKLCGSGLADRRHTSL